MRLIDADALDITLVDAQSTCKKNGGNFRYGVLSNVRANIADAPTIDAIPVEWLKQRALDANDPFSPYMMVMFAWYQEQKEQEAQK